MLACGVRTLQSRRSIFAPASYMPAAGIRAPCPSGVRGWCRDLCLGSHKQANVAHQPVVVARRSASTNCGRLTRVFAPGSDPEGGVTPHCFELWNRRLQQADRARPTHLVACVCGSALRWILVDPVWPGAREQSPAFVWRWKVLPRVLCSEPQSAWCYLKADGHDLMSKAPCILE